MRRSTNTSAQTSPCRSPFPPCAPNFVSPVTKSIISATSISAVPPQNISKNAGWIMPASCSPIPRFRSTKLQHAAEFPTTTTFQRFLNPAMGYVLLNIKSAKILQNHNEHIILFCIKNEEGIKTTILPRVQVLIVRKKLSQNIFSKIRPKKQKSPCKTRTFSLSCQIDLQRWLPLLG